jgi:hypothetical protein
MDLFPALSRKIQPFHSRAYDEGALYLIHELCSNCHCRMFGFFERYFVQNKIETNLDYRAVVRAQENSDKRGETPL